MNGEHEEHDAHDLGDVQRPGEERDRAPRAPRRRRGGLPKREAGPGGGRREATLRVRVPKIRDADFLNGFSCNAFAKLFLAIS